MLRRLALVLAMTLLPLLPCACQPRFVHESVTSLLIVDAATLDPVVGANVDATVAIRFDGREVGTIGPTDALGTTFVPLLRIGDRPFFGTLTVMIESDDRTETIQIENKEFARTDGRFFAVIMLSTDTELPRPLIIPITGSSPPRLRVVGYTTSFGVCSNSSAAVTWSVTRSGSESILYTDLLVDVGTVPAGFVGYTVDDPDVGSCPVAVDSVAPDGFTPFVGLLRPISDQLASNPYCFTPEGGTIACR